MSRAIEQKPNLDGFVKPGELVEVRAGAGLSLQDRRIFNLLIEHAWPEIGESKTHRIAISRLRGPHHESGDRVAESVETLMRTIVKVPVMLEGQPAVFSTQLLGSTTRTLDEDSPNALLEYEFPEKLRKIIQESLYWGRIKSHIMFAYFLEIRPCPVRGGLSAGQSARRLSGFQRCRFPGAAQCGRY